MLIEKLDHYGRGITKVDNKVYFVTNAIDFEEVELTNVVEHKKYNEAEVDKYINKSPNRINPNCTYYNLCGGCSVSHMSDQKQLSFKQNKVIDIVNKFSKINCDIKDIVSSSFYNYRNKVVLHVRKDKLGFYKNKTNELIEIEECLLLDNKINEIIKYLKQFIKEENNINKITIKIGNITKEVMLIIEGRINNYKSLLNIVDVLIINDKIVTKKDYILSVIGDKKYKISKNSFFQVNEFIAEKLYNEVKEIVEKQHSNNVLDLYCGTGTIGIYIANIVNKVIGIEVVKDAVKDANFNKKLNDVENITFIEGKVEEKINNIKDEFDTVILDPPRSGLHKNVVDTLLKINPKNIIYVSCDPITLLRDLNLLNKEYNVEYIKPFDMFPNTYHVECVCVLKLR